VWNVGWLGRTNQWIDDFVGWTPDKVTYYRAHFRTPCGASALQYMNVFVGGDTGQYYLNYFSDQLGPQLPDLQTVTNIRNGVSASETW